MRAVNSQYAKPSMTDLPRDLWDSIVKTVMNTPAPDFSDMDRDIAELDERIREEKAANARQNS